MQVLVNAFLRFLSFLLPPSWLQLAFRWWVGGDECGGSPWPNRGAPSARRKPLIAHEEVTARGDSRPPGRVSLAAAPAPSAATAPPPPPPPPPALPAAAGGSGLPSGRIRETVEFVISEHRCREARSPRSPRDHPEGVAEDPEAPCRARWSATVMSAATELPNPVEIVGACADQRLREMGTPVTITVAIQAAEDEEPDEEETINSEDEIVRHEKSRCVFLFFSFSLVLSFSFTFCGRFYFCFLRLLAYINDVQAQSLICVVRRNVLFCPKAAVHMRNPFPKQS